MKLVADNPWLEPWREHIKYRHKNYLEAKKRIEGVGGYLEHLKKIKRVNVIILVSISVGLYGYLIIPL